MSNQRYLLETCLGVTNLKECEDLSVSVVVPFFNRSRFLKRLLDSVAAQTLAADRVYIIDNGSSLEESLNAWKIIRSHTLYDKCVFTSSIGRGNANYARNLGYKLAETRYVAFLDSDDWWQADHLSKAIKLLNKSDKVATYSGARVHKANGVILNNSKDIKLFDDPFSLIMSPRNYLAQTSSYVIDKSKVSLNVLWDESLKRHQDYDYFAVIYYNTCGWCYNPNITSNIDWNEGGHKSALDFNSLIKFYEKWEDSIPYTIKKSYLASMLYQSYFYNANDNIKIYYKEKITQEIFFKSSLYRVKTSDLCLALKIKAIKILDELQIKNTIKDILNKRL